MSIIKDVNKSFAFYFLESENFLSPIGSGCKKLNCEEELLVFLGL